MKPYLKYLSGYPSDIIQKVENLLESGQLETSIKSRYPEPNKITNDKMLYEYVQDLKKSYLKSSNPISKAIYDKKISVDHHALGLHSTVSRVQGKQLKSKSEIRIAEVYKEAPQAFFRAVVVHELAHLKEKDHNKAFFQLCKYMEPDYHQIDFDMRLFLILRDYKKQILKD